MEKVTYWNGTETCYAKRETDNVLTVKLGDCPDSDMVVLTDENGFRYKREITLTEKLLFIKI